jgi:hypothetical protein
MEGGREEFVVVNASHRRIRLIEDNAKKDFAAAVHLSEPPSPVNLLSRGGQAIL